MNPILNTPLKETGAYKDRLRQLLFDNELVRQLVMPVLRDDTASPQENWLASHCLDIPCLDEQITDERSLLLIECLPTNNSSLRRFTVTVTVCCHKNLIALSPETRLTYFNQYGLTGNLVDMISMAVDAALSGDAVSRSFGVGRIQMAPEKPVLSFLPNATFYGKTLSYEIFEMRKR